MSPRTIIPPRVIAFFPTTHGFGFAVFEGPSELVDWGAREVRGGRREEFLAKIEALLSWHRPDVVVLENYAGEGSKRGKRIQALIRSIAKRAAKLDVKVASYSRGLIRQCFLRYQARTKHEIAEVIAREFPELELRLPPKRKPWMSEHYRMSMFDAAALALTHFFFGSADNGD